VTGTADRRIVLALNDLIRFTDTASRLVARGKSAYESDEAVRLAAEAILHKIGEAVTRLPEEFIVAHPDVTWRSMKATRNIVAHEDEPVDYDLMWNALAHRLPVEAERIRQILAGIDTR
jgi:uncharacterized protein with HEPN domain